MILKAVFSAKAFLLLAALLCMGFLFRGVLKKRQLFALVAVLAVFACVAQWISGYVPPLTDEVTLTALGEKNEEAMAEEIFLQGFTVDQKGCAIDRPAQGKWFWAGEAYAWRIETDLRQPDGVTRAVTLQVPVGWSRTADFWGDIWRGKVQIDSAAGGVIADTYLPSAGILSIPIGRSETRLLIFNQMRKLAVFLTVFAALTLAGLLALRWTIRSPKEAKAWFTRHSSHLLYGSIALFTLFFMIFYVDRISFWIDEMAAVTWTGGGNGNVKDAIRYCLASIDATPPLFTICATLWHKVAPYGERSLLMISMIPCAVAIYFIALTGERLRGKCVGALSAVFCAASTAVWKMQAYEFRAYAFALLFSALTLYCFVCRNQNPHRTRWHIGYSLALLGMGMSHYFGMLVCAGFFLCDVCLLAKKRIHWTAGFDYVFPGAVCSGWLIAVLTYNNGAEKIAGMLMGWQDKPGFYTLKEHLYELSGNTDFTLMLLIFGMGLGLVGLLARKREFEWTMLYQQFSTLLIIGIFSVMAVYGVLINPKAPMWMCRYFMLLVPHVCLLMANGITFAAEKICGGKEIGLLGPAACFSICAALIVNCLSLMSCEVSSEPYREAANWIYEQGDIFYDTTAIISRDDYFAATGWQTYYIAQEGRRDELNVIPEAEMTVEKLLQYDRVYAQYCRAEVRADLTALLNQYYTLEMDRTDIHVRVYRRKPA